jgi:hypothetical protein
VVVSEMHVCGCGLPDVVFDLQDLVVARGAGQGGTRLEALGIACVCV